MPAAIITRSIEIFQSQTARIAQQRLADDVAIDRSVDQIQRKRKACRARESGLSSHLRTVGCVMHPTMNGHGPDDQAFLHTDRQGSTARIPNAISTRASWFGRWSSQPRLKPSARTAPIMNTGEIGAERGAGQEQRRARRRRTAAMRYGIASEGRDRTAATDTSRAARAASSRAVRYSSRPDVIEEDVEQRELEQMRDRRIEGQGRAQTSAADRPK